MEQDKIKDEMLDRMVVEFHQDMKFRNVIREVAIYYYTDR